jgi:hypothetical protein
MRRWLLQFVVMGALSCSIASASAGQAVPVGTTGLQDSVLRPMLALGFGEFDQDMTGGWRRYEVAKDYLTAARILDAYRVGRDSLRAWQQILLSFHAGQMYAYAERTDTAIARFLIAADSESVGPGWEPYVRATIAFLRRDRGALEEAYRALVAAPTPDGPDPNVRVVESFLAHFDWSYARAYEAAARP